MHIDLRDDGPGLAPRIQGNLFQPVDGSAKAGGTGLGLAIAGELMRNHGSDCAHAVVCRSANHCR
ncbi:MAG: ATP-binding protein [Pseudomonadota bacterium]|nr:ATP-binding protein [Pseudomonadota bacterium]